MGKVKPSRRRSREFVLQGLYQWRLAAGDPDAIRVQFEQSREFARADAEYFRDIWTGITSGVVSLEGELARHLDRDPAQLSPVERAILLIGAYELAHRSEVPYRVAISEAVELAKSYGATDGYKFVNGVLDKLAARLRANEIAGEPRRP